jgi:hypothetical protein
MTTILEVLQKTLGEVLTWWVIVAPWEQALRVRGGRHVRTLGPGIYLRIPFIDMVYRQTVRRRVCTLPTQTMTTRDRKTITLGATVGYVIADIRLLYNTLHDAEATLINIAAQTIAEAVSTRDLLELTPATVAQLASDRLSFDRFGLSECSVQITDWAVIRAYRLISDARWCQSSALDVHTKS